jgi:hypothetical protein
MERRWAHTVVTVFMLTLLTAGGCSQTVRENSNKSSDAVSMDISWQKYKGAWFTIQYPPNFSVSPSLPAEQSGEYDSVFFVAPDNNISFYVLSPQWRRRAEDIVLQPSLEVAKEIDERLMDGFTEKSRLIQAIDGSYERLIESYTSLDQTVSWTFQLYYTDSKAKKSYEKQYQQFKASLDQYTD